MARNVGEFIKDIVYEKYWFIYFIFRDGKYVYCKPDRYKFLPLNTMSIDEASKANIVKFATEEEAKKQLAKIPDLDINGVDISFEISENSYHEFLIGL